MKNEAGKSEKTGRDLAPPYISFKTLLALLDRMQAGGIPPLIDRSFLTGMSGGYQTQVLNALRYLGLIIGEDGRVAERVYDLVDPETRKTALATLLSDRFPEAAALGEAKATHGQLIQLFRDQYDLAAETQDKAIAFYLQAARYADAPVSPFFKKPRVSSGTRKRTARRKVTKSVPEDSATPPTPGGKSMFSVRLGGGGKVTLLGDFDPFELAPDEREFVYDLVDKMREHQEQHGAEPDDQVDANDED